MGLEDWDLVLRSWAGSGACARRFAIDGLAPAGSPTAETSALNLEARTSPGKLQRRSSDLISLRRQCAVRQGEQTRHYSLAPHAALVREIDCAGSDAYHAYSLVSGIRPDTIRQALGFNLPIVLILQHELRKRGIETRRRHWFSAGKTKQFLETTELPGGGTLFIDPAWQTSLPEDSDYAAQPYVLIAPPDRIGEILAAHGVPDARQDGWREAEVSVWEPSSSADWLRWNPRLAKLFRDEPFHPPLGIRTNST